MDDDPFKRFIGQMKIEPLLQLFQPPPYDRDLMLGKLGADEGIRPIIHELRKPRQSQTTVQLGPFDREPHLLL